MEAPVDVVDLQLAELHVLAIHVKKGLQYRDAPVTAKADMANPAGPLLLEQIRYGAEAAVVQIVVYVGFLHVVTQVKVEVLNAAFFKLLLENLLDLAKVWIVVAGKLGGEVKALARILCQRTPEHLL